MQTLLLSVTANVTLSGGAGTISVGPKYTTEVWRPTSVSISCTGNQPTPTAPLIATCSIYSGITANNGTFVDATYQVLGASSSMISGATLYGGQFVFAVWANCNSGVIATMTVTGIREVP
jgi:hypothetical protein